jgi:GntR family transcriptional repressor for pyruvate dehydrogenase complex
MTTDGRQKETRMLKAVKKTRASEEVVKQIINLIENGKLKKGEQLPSERELTLTLKVSRTTVREAIRYLESMRLVETRQGEGTYVVVSSEEARLQPLAAGLFTEKDDLRDIFYLRKIIEPSIAQLAAGYATSEEIKELEDILHRQESELAEGKNPVALDTLFHITLARIAKNRVLGRLLHALVELLVDSRENMLENSTRAHKSIKGHWEILAAIRREDCSAARESMLDHLNEIEGVIFKTKKPAGKCGTL